MVVWNAKVVTVDAGFSRAQAVAIRNGVFAAVGTNDDVKKLIGAETRVIDARGKTVVPGLIETHVHATGAARGEVTQPFVQLHSIGEIQDWVRARAKEAPAGTWIQLPRVDVTRIREGRIPTRADLDAAAPNHPAVFTWDYGGLTQVQVLNSAAIKAAGLTKATPAPEGGKIHLGPDGELTGVVDNGRALLNKVIPQRPVSEAEYLQSLARLMGRYNEVGITSISERSSGPDGYRNYQQLKSEGRLPVRVNVTIRINPDGTVEGAERVLRALPFKYGDGDDWVRVGPLKIGVDGGALYGTAYMREPYPKSSFALYRITEPDYRGSFRPGITAGRPEELIRTGHRLGWQMSTHVTGDAGVDAVLDAVEAANADSPIVDRRFTLIHAYFPDAKTAQRAARLGVVVDTQPVVLQGRRRAGPRPGERPHQDVHRVESVAAGRRHDRAQRGSHAGVRSDHVAEPVPSVPRHVHRRHAQDPERPGHRPRPARVARGRPAHDDHQRRQAQLRRDAEGIDRGRQVRRSRDPVG